MNILQRYKQVLVKLPGVTEEIAEAMIQAGVKTIKEARKAERDSLREMGLKAGDADKIKAGKKK